MGLSAGTALGGTMGAGVYGMSQIFPEKDQSPAVARQDVKDAAANKIAVEQKMARIQQKAGEACVSAMTPYRRPNGILQGTVTDTIVGDLLGDPNKPCGATPTQVREQVVGMQSIDNEMQDAETYIDNTHSSLREAQENYSPPPTLTESALLTAAIGSVVGLGCALFVDRDHRSVPEGDVIDLL